MATDFGTAFGAGTQAAVASILSAVATPLMASVTLWIIIQGILVMRGDIDTRRGVTRIIRVALVVGLLTSSGLYTNYVQTTFTTTLPNWFASISGGTSISSTPQTFDNMFSVTEHVIETTSAQIALYDVIDAVTLSLTEIVIIIMLVVAFAVYLFATVVTGIMVAIGPVIIVGYLFESTKGITDRWIGKLINYALLILLINVTLNIVLQGEKTYLRYILTQQAGGLAAVPAELKILLQLAMFYAMGAFIIVSLPAIAAAIGGGHGGSPGAAMMSTITNVATGGASRVASAASRGLQGAGAARGAQAAASRTRT